MVGFRRQRDFWLWKFSCLSGLRISRHVAWRRNVTHPSLLCYWFSKIASVPGSATRHRFLVETRRIGQLAFASRDGSCASFGCRWRHDCGWFDGHDIWHDPSVCATGSDLHGPGEVRSANNKYAPDTLDCARSGWLWRRDLHDGSHGAPLRVVCQALTKSLADTVSRRCNWVCRGNRSTSDCGLQRSASPGACHPRSNHVRRRFDPVLAANAIALNHNLLCPDTLHL